MGDIEEVIPESYYLVNDSKIGIKVHFQKIENGVFGLKAESDIPQSSLLVIDPKVIRLWGTYYGGPYQDGGYDFCSYDDFGNVFLTAWVSSLTNIATTGSYQETIGGDYDVFLVKFNPAGQRQWGTYLGGTGDDRTKSCIIDKRNAIYISGFTTSPNAIASSGAHQTVFGGNWDCFIEKFNEAGFRSWGTYYGGSGSDQYGAISIDYNNFVYITGQTTSASGIATSGSYQPILSSTAGNAFLAKFDSNGVRQWGTYYGGEIGSGTGAECCTTDYSGNIYFGGNTSASTNIASLGAYQSTFGGIMDGFITKFTTNGQRLWATYYGGTLIDAVHGCITDSTKNVFLIGETNSPSGIASTGCHQFTLGGGIDDFIVKFDSTGLRLWGTYYGGSLAEGDLSGCKVGYNGDLFISGTTRSNNNISTPDSYQPNIGGGRDAFLTKFNATGQRQWGTYYGGLNDDGSEGGITYVHDDTIYLAGYTWSTSGISTPGAFQEVLGGQSDAMLIKFLDCWPISAAGPISGSINVCQNSIGVTYSIPILPHAINYIWTLPAGASITSGNGTHSIIVSFNGSATSGDIWVKGLNKCGDAGDSAFLYVTIHPRPVPVITGPSSTCAGPGKVYSTASGMSNYQWSTSAGGLITLGGTISDNTATVTWTAAGNQTISVNYTDANGCEGLAPTVYNVTVDPSPAVGVTISAPSNNVCSGTLVTFTAIPSNEGTTPFYQWKVNGLNAGTSGTSYTYAPLNGDVVTCVLTSSITGCILNNPATSNANTMTVNPYLPVTVSISPSQNPYCAGTTVTFTATPNNQGTTPFYQWKVNGINAGGNNVAYSYIPTNGDIVICILNSSVPCPTGNPATSNTLTMVENTNVTVSVSIAPSQNSVCSGTTVLFLATPLNQGTAPVYQWKVNGIIAGTNSPVFSYVPLNGDLVTCTLTSNAPCAAGNPATSNTVTMIVNSNQPVSISITSTGSTVCAGTSVTFNAFPINQGTAPFYQWKVNGINAGTNSTTYSYVPLNGDQVSCVLNSNATCATGNPATSNVITMTVNPNLSVSINITVSANPVCSGIAVTYTTTPNNGGGSPVYQWKVNGVIAGTNSTTYTYNPVAGDQVLCILNSSIACPIGNPATSNTITMNVGAVPVVTFTTCFDTITTLNAKPFKLKGGIPLNGTYSGPGVSANIFNPAAAGIGTKTITYTYT
ncbi:MAG: hypothetical protein WCL00_07465, partial [Bacteroidota bacterium]